MATKKELENRYKELLKQAVKVDEILNIDVNNLTPLEALNKLSDIKKIVRGK